MMRYGTNGKSIKLWVDQGDSTLIKWRKVQRHITDGCLNLSQRNCSVPKFDPSIYIKALTFRLRFEYLTPSSHINDIGSNRGCWPPGFYVKRKCLSRFIYSLLKLCALEEEGSELHLRLQTEPWDCIVLGKTIVDYPFVLVLDWVGETAERIGHVAFEDYWFGDYEYSNISDILPTEEKLDQSFGCEGVWRTIHLG